MFRRVRPLLGIFGGLSLLLAVGYPVLVTGVAQLVFPDQANGSLIRKEGRNRGSALVGQPFVSERYFWGRPSATPGGPYNAMASGGSNLGPSNPSLRAAVAARADLLRGSNPQQTADIPVDLVTASASGLDPHISVEAAKWQAPRVAGARGMAESDVMRMIYKRTERFAPWMPGEPGVNVLLLNLDLENLEPPATK